MGRAGRATWPLYILCAFVAPPSQAHTGCLLVRPGETIGGQRHDREDDDYDEHGDSDSDLDLDSGSQCEHRGSLEERSHTDQASLQSTQTGRQAGWLGWPASGQIIGLHLSLANDNGSQLAQLEPVALVGVAPCADRDVIEDVRALQWRRQRRRLQRRLRCVRRAAGSRARFGVAKRERPYLFVSSLPVCPPPLSARLPETSRQS